MEIYHSLDAVPDPEDMNVALTLGFFDGLHLGHQKILGKVAEYHDPGVQVAAAVTFDPHPLRILNPKSAPALLSPLKEKLKLINEYKLSYLLVLDFNKELSGTSASDFIEKVLVERLGVKKIIVGHDVHFGRGGEGNGKSLQASGKKYGFDVEIVSAVKGAGGKAVSSTAIRKALQEKGDARAAAAMLGQPYSLTGEVVKGLGLGKKLGIPTANIKVNPEKLVPLYGVYAAYVYAGGKRMRGVMNVGVRPTIPLKKPTRVIEVHIMDFAEDVYGKELKVEFVRYVRPEKKFGNAKLLVAQIQKDIAIANMAFT